MKKLCHYISEYMGVLVLLSAIAALVLPGVFSQVKPTVINPLLGVIMFGMGLTLRADDFRIVFSRPKDVVIGCLAQFTVTPLLAKVLAYVKGLVTTQQKGTDASVRNGWAAAAKQAHADGEDKLMVSDVFEDETMEDWKW